MRAQVAVLRTRPETVLVDYGRLMRLAKDCLLRLNLSWTKYFPWMPMLERYGLPFIPLTEVEWIRYHDLLWYPTIGRARIRAFGETAWGRLFEGY
ncbi:MAG: hypothetical protein HYU24_11460 [Candidatus Rokubacteria bacterium]|nr:hypothetical protein [Candidatus Rokubacteria bacterium]